VCRHVCVVVNEGCRKPSGTQCVDMFSLKWPQAAQMSQKVSLYLHLRVIGKTICDFNNSRFA